MDKLIQLINRCRCGVFLHANPHRDAYQSVEDWLRDQEALMEFVVKDILPPVRDRMVKLDTIVDLHFYPNTPVSFWRILHYDLDAALDWALGLDMERPNVESAQGISPGGTIYFEEEGENR